MLRFEFVAPDSLSDAGTATVVILANGSMEAKMLLKQHLREKMRGDLYFGIKHRSTTEVPGVIYSDVEERTHADAS